MGKNVLVINHEYDNVPQTLCVDLHNKAQALGARGHNLHEEASKSKIFVAAIKLRKFKVRHTWLKKETAQYEDETIQKLSA